MEGRLWKTKVVRKVTLAAFLCLLCTSLFSLPIPFFWWEGPPNPFSNGMPPLVGLFLSLTELSPFQLPLESSLLSWGNAVEWGDTVRMQTILVLCPGSLQPIVLTLGPLLFSCAFSEASGEAGKSHTSGDDLMDPTIPTALGELHAFGWIGNSSETKLTTQHCSVESLRSLPNFFPLPLLLPLFFPNISWMESFLFLST